MPLATVSGPVEQNIGKGHEIGYPTANVIADPSIPDGTYIAYTEVESQRHQSIVFIGSTTHYSEQQRHIETHLLDFRDDIYGKTITIIFLEKIRDNKRFDSVEQLIEQLDRDVQTARRYFRRKK